MTFHATLLSGLLVAGSWLHAQEPELLNDAFLARIRAEAARNHPAAAASLLRAQAAAADGQALRLWDDPMAGLSVMGADRMMRRDEGDIKLMIEQPLPKPGLYQASKDKAGAMQRAEQAKSINARLELGAAAARTAIELALADESLSLQTQQLGWLQEMAANARERAINPEMTSAEPLRMESELVKETQLLESAKRIRSNLASKLNLQLGRGIGSAWPTLRLPVKSLLLPIAKAEVARISRTNPMVLSLKEMTTAAKAETRMADRERQPGFSITAGSSSYSGTGDYRSAEVGVKMSLPWFNDHSYQAKVDAAALREKAAAADVDTLIREIEIQVIAAVTEATNAAAQADAYSGEVESKARLTTESIQSSWISSTATLAELLETRRLLFSIRLDQRRFIAMQLSALEELNVLVPRK